MLVQSNHQHDKNPCRHPQYLQYQPHPVSLLLLVGGYGVRVTRAELRHHVHQSNVEEDSSSSSEHPG